MQLYFAFLPCIWISVFSILIVLKKTRQPTYIGNSQVNVLSIEKQLKIDIPFDVCTSKISWQKQVPRHQYPQHRKTSYKVNANVLDFMCDERDSIRSN